jgi:hypothetical protein
MQKLISVLGTCVISGTLFSLNSQDVVAQSCNYFAGTAVGGQEINLDTCSISRASYRSVDFIYYLGSEKVVSQANCDTGTWTTFPEKQVNRPQSQATQRMLDFVCNSRTSSPSRNSSSARKAFVFDPPSNIRTEPNGSVLCSITTPTTINIYGSLGSWYYTDACGETGVVHSSQIRFR